MIEIRAAVPDDADELAAAHTEGWRVGYRGLMPDELLDAPTFAMSRRDMWRAWTWPALLPGSELFVAARDGRVVGFGHCGPERVEASCDAIAVEETMATIDSRGEVYGFYLHPDAWGSGAATPLMHRCEQYLREIHFGAAVLWVLRDNPRARGFYEKVGWAPTGRSTLFHGSPAFPLPEPLVEVEYQRVLADRPRAFRGGDTLP